MPFFLQLWLSASRARHYCHGWGPRPHWKHFHCAGCCSLADACGKHFLRDPFPLNENSVEGNQPTSLLSGHSAEEPAAPACCCTSVLLSLGSVWHPFAPCRLRLILNHSRNSIANYLLPEIAILTVLAK